MAIIDVTTFNGEHDLFEIRYEILKDYVDEFIVLEFDKTFSGKPKERTFTHIPYEKVNYSLDTEDVYSKYLELAESSPNTRGADHWKREFSQKESIKDYLTHLNDDDVCFIGDVDEVWDPKFCLNNLEVLEPNDTSFSNGTAKIHLKVYTYYLNNRSSEEFYGTLVGKYKYIKGLCLNHLRSYPKISKGGSGWHFTSMGGYENVKKKLSDSYTQESYWSDTVQGNLEYNIKENKDFLGRDFTYRIDESEWPDYLRKNKDKYLHLCK